MRQVFHPGFTRDSRYPCCGIDVYGTEGFSAMLHVQADGVYASIGSLQGCSDLGLVVHIGSQGGQPGGARVKRRGRSVRVSRHCPDIKLVLKQVFHDPAAEEAGPAEYGNKPARGRNRLIVFRHELFPDYKRGSLGAIRCSLALSFPRSTASDTAHEAHSGSGGAQYLETVTKRTGRARLQALSRQARLLRLDGAREPRTRRSEAWRLPPHSQNLAPCPTSAKEGVARRRINCVGGSEGK